MLQELKALLRAVEVGEPRSFAALAEWLEARGDPRARLAREAMETVPADIAQLVYEERLWHAHPRNHPDIEPVVTLEQCLKDVEKALRSKSLPLDIARAMKAIRQRRIESLMKQFG